MMSRLYWNVCPMMYFLLLASLPRQQFSQHQKDCEEVTRSLASLPVEQVVFIKRAFCLYDVWYNWAWSQIEWYGGFRDFLSTNESECSKKPNSRSSWEMQHPDNILETVIVLCTNKEASAYSLKVKHKAPSYRSVNQTVAQSQLRAQYRDWVPAAITWGHL